MHIIDAFYSDRIAICLVIILDYYINSKFFRLEK